MRELRIVQCSCLLIKKLIKIRLNNSENEMLEMRMQYGMHWNEKHRILQAILYCDRNRISLYVYICWKREFSRSSFFSRFITRNIQNLCIFRRVNPSMKKSKLEEFSHREFTSRTVNGKCILLFLQTFKGKYSLAILVKAR